MKIENSLMKEKVSIERLEMYMNKYKEDLILNKQGQDIIESSVEDLK